MIQSTWALHVRPLTSDLSIDDPQVLVYFDVALLSLHVPHLSHVDYRVLGTQYFQLWLQDLNANIPTCIRQRKTLGPTNQSF